MRDRHAEREPGEILELWLETVGPSGWYAADAALDAEIRERFEGLWSRAAAGCVDHWLCNPRNALALLILLDQFPRNMHRGSHKAYASDQKARASACRAISLGHDIQIPEPERQFFYLPLMHSESLSDQERCLRLILLRMPLTGAMNLEHGVKHRDVIRRFGRFPSRNAALGRADRPEECAYRDDGGYMG